MGKGINGKELGKGIVQLKDKRYRATYTDMVGNKKRIYNTSLMEIRKKLEASRAYFVKAELDKDKNVILDDFFAIWLQEKSKTIEGNTQSGYRHSFKHISNAMGYKKVKDITVDDFTELFADLLEQGYKVGEIQTLKMVARQVFRKAVENQIILFNPLPKRIKDIFRFITDETKVQSMSEEEQSRYLEYIFGINHCYKEAIAFLLLTGLRFGELVSLEWEDVDWNNKMLHVKRGMREYQQDGKRIIEMDNPKTKSSIRQIPLLDEAVSILRLQKRSHPSADAETLLKYGNLIFTNEGKVITHSELSYKISCIEQEMKDQDIPMCHVTPHVFRHTFITRCVESGMNPKAIATIAGHRSISITMNRYTTLSKDFLQKSINKLSSDKKKH
jgi:integrase